MPPPEGAGGGEGGAARRGAPFKTAEEGGGGGGGIRRRMGDPGAEPEGPPEYRVYRSRKPLFRKRAGDDRDELARLRGDAGRAPVNPPSRAASPSASAAAARPRPPAGARRRRFTRGRIIRWVLLAIAGWIAISALVFLVSAQIQQGKVSDANHLLGGAGYPATSPNNILVLGSDVRTSANAEPGAQTTGNGRSDSILLMRIGGGANSRMSIARDTVVDIPGAGRQKINAAYAIGGAALAVQTIEGFTGIDINHVMIVSFENFPALIDAMGGITYQRRLRRLEDQRRLQERRLHAAPAGRQVAHRRQAGAGAGAHA